jgi:hypothetical protein
MNNAKNEAKLWAITPQRIRQALENSAKMPMAGEENCLGSVILNIF